MRRISVVKLFQFEVVKDGPEVFVPRNYFDWFPLNGGGERLLSAGEGHHHLLGLVHIQLETGSLAAAHKVPKTCAVMM